MRGFYLTMVFEESSTGAWLLSSTAPQMFVPGCSCGMETHDTAGRVSLTPNTRLPYCVVCAHCCRTDAGV